MSDPTFVTFTGVDRFVDRCGLIELAALEGVEIGILYTVNPEDRNRYPTRKEIMSLIDDLHEDMSPDIALHICGNSARVQLFNGELCSLLEGVSRVQINGLVSLGELKVAAQSTDKIIITQHHPKNIDLLNSDIETHELLCDVSGGRGILPERFERPDTNKNVGYAGGLDPITIQYQWPAIQLQAKQFDWIDMETGIRTDDKFDVKKCFQIYQYLIKK